MNWWCKNMSIYSVHNNNVCTVFVYFPYVICLSFVCLCVCSGSPSTVKCSPSSWLERMGAGGLDTAGAYWWIEISRINKCAATEQEVAKYHDDGWVNKRAKIVGVPVGKQSISESERKCVRLGNCVYVPLHMFLSMYLYCVFCFYSVYA